ncbi:MAG: adenylate kinase [uncultured archaeon A07HR60]|nr:MAG: adenylate kinase [uncultured archaeon A07HR60]
MSQRILLLGAPGAGKGTQSGKLADKYGLEHVTTGDALRANKDMETDHGTPREYMEAGDLVPDPVVNEIVKAALEEADGYVLDGYPRNLSQAEYLDDITSLDTIAHLDVDEDVLLRRLTGRRVCEECGENYHTEFQPPAESGVCDRCGGALLQRDDDTEEVATDRLGVFRENTQPVIDYYREEGVLTDIDGEAPPDEVFDDIVDVIEATD